MRVQGTMVEALKTSSVTWVEVTVSVWPMLQPGLSMTPPSPGLNRKWDGAFRIVVLPANNSPGTASRS